MLPEADAPDVFQSGFESAWKKASADVCSIRLPAKCSKCILRVQCKACAAMVYTETGNFHTVPQYRCKMAHEYINACLQLETEIRKRGVSNNEK